MSMPNWQMTLFDCQRFNRESSASKCSRTEPDMEFEDISARSHSGINSSNSSSDSVQVNESVNESDSVRTEITANSRKL